MTTTVLAMPVPVCTLRADLSADNCGGNMHVQVFEFEMAAA
ncbi:hypothetical protein [Glycomyces halotolerans]